MNECKGEEITDCVWMFHACERVFLYWQSRTAIQILNELLRIGRHGWIFSLQGAVTMGVCSGLPTFSGWKIRGGKSGVKGRQEGQGWGWVVEQWGDLLNSCDFNLVIRRECITSHGTLKDRLVYSPCVIFPHLVLKFQKTHMFDFGGMRVLFCLTGPMETFKNQGFVL